MRDNVAAGVLEPLMSKVKSLKSAYEAAVSILRIDDAIQCVPGVFFCFVLMNGLSDLKSALESKGEPDPHGH